MASFHAQGRDGPPRKARGGDQPIYRLSTTSTAARRPMAALLGILLGAMAGCAHGPAQPPQPPRPKAGYERLADSLAAVDTTVLAGRRVALDPGHGGFFTGAVGVHGLTEAQVNLAVALKLRDLLVAHGVDVFLTRDRDRDFITSPQDSTLKADLTERVRLVNAFDPDLFVSIHHNADARGSHDVNETQTYYKFGDEGPSLDAAENIHRSLVLNLGIETNKVVPGNYFVLRGSTAPALLTESSYLTNPDVEKMLALPEKQQLEADALYIGIARYFARRVPSIARFALRPEPGAFARAGSEEARRAFASPMLEADVRGTFDRAELTLNGVPAPLERTGQHLSWQAVAPPPQGEVTAVLRVRLAGQGAAPAETVRFTVRRPPVALEVEPWPARLPTAGGVQGLRIALRDGYGQLAIDSLAVRLRSRDHALEPRDTTVIAHDGIAWAYVRVPPAKPAPHGRRRQAPPAPPVHGPIVASLEGMRARSDTARIVLGQTAEHAAFLAGMPGGAALVDAPGTREPLSPNAWLNRDGFARWTSMPGDSTAPTLPGYRPWLADSTSPADSFPQAWVAIAGGALHGRRITLDPDGGGEDPAGIGRGGTRGASLNLETARMLAGMLTAAGADVMITRAGDFALSDVERVQASEAFHADRYLRIGHRAEPARAGYYFSSAAGQKWAQRTARELAGLGLPAIQATEVAQYPLQQTSCPALYVSPARVDDRATEARLLAPGTLRTEAYALFLGLAREWAGDVPWASDSLVVRDARGKPAAGAPVTLGGALMLETDALGMIRFARTEPGPIMIEADVAGVRVRRVLIDSERGIVLTGSINR